MPTVDFATFCYAGDAHRLHAPGQLKRQVESNGYPFNRVIVVYQNCSPIAYGYLYCNYSTYQVAIPNIDNILKGFGIDLSRDQYQSPTDKHHTWRQHVVNHLMAAKMSQSDYIVFADNDCWMIKQPDSWVKRGIEILEQNPDVFVVSPNDGELERKTQVMSQQMFMTRTDEFRQADFNQPGWDGNPHVEGGPLPEYWSMLEGRIALYCKHVNKYRYVLPPEYRYWHFNRTTQDGMLETDMSKY